MRANELRIGNWLKDSSGRYYRASPTTILDLWESEKRDWVNAIPLTPEILEKAGFKKTGAYSKCGVYNLEKGYLWFCDGIAGHCIEVNHLDYDTNTSNITYLHQLQNLYFALTNTELNIEL